MNTDKQAPWFSGIPKQYLLLAGAVVVLCVFALTWLVCSVEYENKKRIVLESHQETMTSWVGGTVNAITLWTESLEAQTKRISGSDMYRLFASELSQMDARTAGLINEAESGMFQSDDMAMMAEEIPYIRNNLLEFMNYSGLMDARLVNPQGQTLLSALSRPTPITPEQRIAVNTAITQDRIAFSVVRPAPSGLVMDVADPLRAIMTADGQEKPVAVIMVTTPITGQVAQFLGRDLRQAAFMPHLLQRNGETWEEIKVQSPVPMPLEASVAAALDIREDGTLSFLPRPGLNDQSHVYSVGNQVPGMDWYVVLEIPAALIEGELKSLGWMIYGIGALIGLGVVLGLALLWWVLVGHQQKIIAQRFENLYKLIDRQKRLLDSVNVSLDVGLFMADTKGTIQIGNRAFAEIARTEEGELGGNTLSALFDGRVSGELLDHIRKVADTEETENFELALPQEDGDHLYRITLFPFEDTTDGGTSGAVAIMQDITEFRRNSEKRRLQQQHTLNAFVRAVEGVDPYLAGHSSKMSVLGDLVAKRMGLQDADRQTITMAANLSQVGKLFVPRDLLNKSGKLTPEEQAEMAKVPEHAYRVLKDIDFELPIPQAIYEMYERMDGTGYPSHKQGDEINIHARVLAVVNAFCAMASPRSYRAGMPVEEALANLESNQGSFDPRIVEALKEVLRTPAGAQALLEVREDTIGE